MKIRSHLVPFACAIALALAACKGQPTHGTGQGTVAAVDLAKHEITLDHGAIPGLMSAMTMTFAVADPKLLDGVAPGAKVEFDVEVRDGAHVVTGVRPR